LLRTSREGRGGGEGGKTCVCVAAKDAYGIYYRRPEALMRDRWKRRCLIFFLLASYVKGREGREKGRPEY